MSFIVQHPRCKVQMRSEYGDIQPIECAVVVSPTQDTQ